MKNIIKLGSILFIICSVASILLSLTNNITSPIIEKRNAIANNESRKLVLPQANEFELINGMGNDAVREVYKGISNSEVIGYTLKSISKGYGGEIEVMVGISKEGKVVGVNIGNNSETPGLGSKASQPEFKNQFNQKSTDKELAVVKGKTNSDNEIVAISGATISSNAVTNSVNAAINLFNEKLNK